MLKFIKRWLIFIRERFDPFTNTVSIGSIFLGCTAVIYAAKPFEIKSRILYFFSGFVLVWLNFFHMRLFDEVKDYNYDLVYNKKRPLPRNLVTLDETGFVTVSCIVLEFIISIFLSLNILIAYIFLLCFTLLMRMEFFIGNWLRPKMELYAIMHTLSASLLGLLIYSLITDINIFFVDISYLYFALGLWFLFNVYEFGRKTYSTEEEKKDVESYSKRLTPRGAYFLVLINIILAVLMLFLSINNLAYNKPDYNFLYYILFSIIILSVFPVLFGIIYFLKPVKINAIVYRTIITIYLFLYNFIIFVICIIFYYNGFFINR